MSLFNENNCWKTATASRFGWLVDGEEYYRALRESMEKAEEEILIVGWDVDSEVDLVRDRKHPHYPSPLAETLRSLVARKASLRVYVLSWDFALVYVLERELLPAYRFGWKDSDRLHFSLDGNHATGASHHQKFVVIDGTLAYIGGFDLTKCRWDTRKHAAEDERRVDTRGQSYRPFHDVQAIVSGEPARRLRELGAFRWHNATGKFLPESPGPESGQANRAWPDSAPARAEDVSVGIARTWAMPDGDGITDEVKRLYIDMIAGARDSIYVENQYFTSASIAAALKDRLAHPAGPEIVMVLPFETSGWLEQITMEARRNQLLNELCDADVHDRLLVVAPVNDELGDGNINVHGKVMVVDDTWCRIGSANLSSRSMGLDSECDIVLEDPGGDAAATLRADLIAEHLGADPDDVAGSIRRHGLLAGLAEHNGGGRRLERLPIVPSSYDAILEPLVRIADLEKPVEAVWRDKAPHGADTDDNLTKIGGWGWLILLLLGIVAWMAWGADIANRDLDPAAVIAALRQAATHPIAPLVVIPAFVIGSLFVLPVTAMIALCGLLFSPWIATGSAIAGTLAATAVNHAIGLRLGRFAERYTPGTIANRMRELGRSSDALSLAGLRLIPIAPFSVINVLAGAFHVSLRDFLLGTLLGMGPGTLFICFSVDRARAALSGEPVFDPWVIVMIVAAGITLVALRVWQQGRSD